MSEKLEILCNDCPFNDLEEAQESIVEIDSSWGLSAREQVERDLLDGLPPEEAWANLDHMYRLEYPTIDALIKCVGARASKLCMSSQSHR